MLEIGDRVIINKEKAKILDILDKDTTKYQKCIIIMLEGENLGSEFSVGIGDLIKGE